MDFDAELARVAGELDVAERERRWSDVATLRAELDAIGRQKVAADTDAQRLAAVALSRKLERERQAAEAATVALQNRLDVWLAQLDGLDEAARQLWPEYQNILGDAAAVAQRCEKVGAANHFLGRLTKTAVACRDGRGALAWRPKVA